MRRWGNPPFTDDGRRWIAVGDAAVKLHPFIRRREIEAGRLGPMKRRKMQGFMTKFVHPDEVERAMSEMESEKKRLGSDFISTYD